MGWSGNQSWGLNNYPSGSNVGSGTFESGVVQGRELSWGCKFGSHYCEHIDGIERPEEG